MSSIPSVLIVEDDPSTLRLYQKIFVKRGYIVYATNNVVEAKALIQEKDFHVIICDMQIGSAYGLHFLRDHHDHLGTVGTQIVVVSGHEHFRSVCEALGIEFYISRPVSTHELGAIVERLITAHRSEDETQASRTNVFPSASATY